MSKAVHIASNFNILLYDFSVTEIAIHHWVSKGVQYGVLEEMDQRCQKRNALNRNRPLKNHARPLNAKLQ